MDFLNYVQILQELQKHKKSFVQVTVVDIKGSNPSPLGSKMIVTEEGIFAGTVGGGKIEKVALDTATTLIKEKLPYSKILHTWNLQRDLGMSCGGEMKLFFELEQSKDFRSWTLVIFGADHVAQALVRILLTLDCQIYVIDPRLEWINKLPSSPKLQSLNGQNLEHCLLSLPKHSFIAIMTQGHATDLPILKTIFAQNFSFPYIGVIGSNQKSKKIKSELRSLGISPENCQKIHCPMGLNFGQNTPAEIALSMAAEMIQIRDDFWPSSIEKDDL